MTVTRGDSSTFDMGWLGRDAMRELYAATVFNLDPQVEKRGGGWWKVRGELVRGYRNARKMWEGTE
jgi:hypothetical protein